MAEDQKEIQEFYRLNPNLKEKTKIKKVKFALSLTQRNEILDKATENNVNHYRLIKIQLFTGMRVGELANLKISQVNFPEKYITVESYENDRYVDNSWKPKTEAGNRIIPIPQSIYSDLRAAIGKKKEGYVFISQKKNKFRIESLIRIVNIYAKECKSIGKNIGSHTLRRTYASYLSSVGEPIAKISKYLGHKSVKITMEYLYEITDLDSMKETRNRLDKMLE